jgi:hypothetical protein
MAKIEVKVLKQAGETGLRLPGTRYLLEESIANNLELRGLVEIVLVKKQEKAVLETKEEKFKVVSKVTKGKKKK